MSTLPLPNPKPLGRALFVGDDGSRPAPLRVLTDLGFEPQRVDDPYAAMLELCRRPLVYRSIVLSLQGLYREELALVTAVKRRFPHVAVWLAHTDGRQATLAEAMRLGAEGLLDDDGLHRFGDADEAFEPAPAKPMQFRAIGFDTEHPAEPAAPVRSEEPVLTAEELRALLGDDLPAASELR